MAIVSPPGILEHCFVCGEVIVDATESEEGENALFCEGEHQQWAHAMCFNIDEDEYLEIGLSVQEWHCPFCEASEAFIKFHGFESRVKSLFWYW